MTIAGSLFGVAFGDAMGRPTEFQKFDAISRVYGKHGPRSLPITGSHEMALVTDDTQMTLYVGKALCDAAESGFVTMSNLAENLTREFIAWYHDPENGPGRAPGGACMSAVGKMTRGADWWKATNPDSKGCGANMRVTPIGLANWLTPQQRSGIAQLQAAMTHWHPTALAAADVTQEAVHLLLNGTSPKDLLRQLIDYTFTAAKWDPREWVGDITDGGRKITTTEVRAWAAQGWTETREILERVRKTWKHGTPSRKTDPCLVGGEGWIAEEALGTALHCFLLFEGDPVGIVGRAAATGGDSDSIAAIAGSFAGAAYGLKAFPADWLGRIEYAAELEALALRLT